jgi:hypothetical protein
VIACLALTVALSGASYAAVVLPRNSVGTAQLKRNAVVSSKIAAGGVGRTDLKANAVNSGKVANGSLLRADFRAGELTVANLIIYVPGPNNTVPASDLGSSTATCPAGYGVISGGYISIAADGEVYADDSFGARNSWTALLDNFDSLVTGTVQAVAYCAPLGQPVAPRSAARGVQDKIDAAIAAQRATH